MMHAKAYPDLKVVSVSPGFVATPMTEGFAAKASAEQGCVSIIKCLFAPVTSGYFYGSDGLRSPLTISRDPGTPEYKGEENPDPAKYSIRYIISHFIMCMKLIEKLKSTYNEHSVHSDLLGVASNHYLVPEVPSFSLVGTIPKTTSDSK